MSGWNEMRWIREKVEFNEGRFTVYGKLMSRGQAKRANTFRSSHRSLGLEGRADECFT